jgi:glutamine amidotransferase
MICYVDTGICNLGSLARAFKRLDIGLRPIRGADEIDSAEAIILPGVGAFGDGMASLRAQGLVEPLRRAAKSGRPVFGICLGMQLLFESSEEHRSQEGLGILRGVARRLDPGGDHRYRVPNIGWCDVMPMRPSRLFPNGTTTCCYFVHSYHVAPTATEIVTGVIDFAGRPVPVAVEWEDVFGVQFHPEKSQDDGLSVLIAFVEHLRESGRLS